VVCAGHRRREGGFDVPGCATGLRVAHRRTLAQWTAIDFAAAVAIGAIVGRTAIANEQSFTVGAAALITILAVHWLATIGLFNSWIVKLVDHRVRVLVRVLVDHGRLRHDQLRLCGSPKGKCSPSSASTVLPASASTVRPV
jgi:hypothetical protein